MTEVTDRELPLDGPIPANFDATDEHNAVMPAPFVQYKKNHAGVIYHRLSYADNLYVVPIVNNHFHYWIVVAPDLSHDIISSDVLRVEWTARDGSRKYVSQKLEVRCIEQPLRFLLPENEVKNFEGVLADIVCVRERKNESDTPSSSRGLFVSPLFKESGSKSVEGVIDGVLDPSAYPEGLYVTTQVLSNLAPGTKVVIQWSHPQQSSHTQILAANLPESDYRFFIDASLYQGASGTSISVGFGLLTSSANFDFWYGIGAIRFLLK